MSNFKIEKRPLNGYNIIDLHGFLDAHTAPDLESELTQLIEAGAVQIIVNFKNLQYIASAGLGVFMAYIEEVREKGGDIKLCEMTDKVFNVFDLLGFPVLYDITPTEDEAVGKFADGSRDDTKNA